MKRVRTLTFFVLFAGTIAAQNEQAPRTPAPEGERNREDEIEIPLPIVSPRALPAGTLEPLSAKGKAVLVLHNIYPRAVANRLLLAGWDQMLDDPGEWPSGGNGFGMRFGSRMGSLAARNAIQLAADVAFRTEPRYDVCACSGFMARTAHAWRRVVIARKDTGEETIGISKLAGAAATPWITHNWYPDHLNTTSDKLTSASSGLALRGVTNMVREFWPDIAKKLRLPAQFGGTMQ